MSLYRKILFILVIVSVSGCSNSYLKFGSSFAPIYDRQSMNQISVFYTNVDMTDINFWGTDKMTQNELNRVNSQFSDSLREMMGREIDIQFIDKTGYDEATINSIVNEAETIHQYLVDNQKMENLNFSYKSNFDYKHTIPELDTKYAFYLNVKPYTTTSYTEWGTYTNHHTDVFSYLIELETGQVAWAFDYSEFKSIENLDLQDLLRTITMAMLYGRDMAFDSFKFDSDKLYSFTEINGESYMGHVTSLDGLILTVDNAGEIIEKHLNEFSKINRASATSTTAGVTVYPKRIK